MSSKRDHWIVMSLSTVGLVLFLSGEQACACGSRMQGRSPPFGMPQFSMPQTYGMRQQVAMQQYILRQYSRMMALQQQAMLVAVQQQQQNALLMAQQPRPQQNGLRAAMPGRLGQQNPGVAQLRPVAEPGQNEPPPRPADPEQVAARQLSLTRELVGDANTVERQGDRDRAAMMRERAQERLQDIIARFPRTKAADAAQELLRKLAP
jgi:hypothetical protein